mmetsp:Transcript_23287/g.59466  ORF Transcript_23287/g.59466 Transcript_23287/m.59466 type:complete len:224 (-) Transcript_23287:548-1219(-)
MYCLSWSREDEVRVLRVPIVPLHHGMHLLGTNALGRHNGGCVILVRREEYVNDGRDGQVHHILDRVHQPLQLPTPCSCTLCSLTLGTLCSSTLSSLMLCILTLCSLKQDVDGRSHRRLCPVRLSWREVRICALDFHPIAQLHQRRRRQRGPRLIARHFEVQQGSCRCSLLNHIVIFGVVVFVFIVAFVYSFLGSLSLHRTHVAPSRAQQLCLQRVILVLHTSR